MGSGWAVCALGLLVLDSSNGWLIAWALCEYANLRSSTLWLHIFPSLYLLVLVWHCRH